MSEDKRFVASYEVAKGKPLLLLNGANLLNLLEEHGHKAKIDLVKWEAIESKMEGEVATNSKLTRCALVLNNAHHILLYSSIYPIS
jgi:S-adenosylhomocysteine hydrolase